MFTNLWKKFKQKFFLEFFNNQEEEIKRIMLIKAVNILETNNQTFTKVPFFPYQIPNSIKTKKSVRLQVSEDKVIGEAECVTKLNYKRINSNLILVSFYGNKFKEIEPAERLKKSDYKISGYINEIAKARKFYGDRSVIDMSMGNPDLRPPKNAQKILTDKVSDLWSHRYNAPKGDSYFFQAAANWMKKRFNIEVNPQSEIMVTSGASDAIDHIFTAYANYNDKVLVPDPGYSLYDDLIVRHDLRKETYDLLPENGYQPDFSKISTDAKIMILNYPNNPTGVFAPKKTYEEAVKFAKENGILIIHDMDNSEITHTGKKPAGIMQAEGAKDVAFEIHTFSKAHSMPGLRVAFAVSSKKHIDNLLNAKYLSGGSVYIPIQYAAAQALTDDEGYITKVNKIYRNRKNTAIKRLNELGSNAKATDGTYYLWVEIPKGFTSDEFFKYVLHKSQIAFTPGNVFGKNGDNFFRIVMSATEKQINTAFDRIRDAGIRFDIPKEQLRANIQSEIEEMANNTYFVKNKKECDYRKYLQKLQILREEMLIRIKNKDPKFNLFIPEKNLILPRNILMNEQYVYLQNLKDGQSEFAQIKDIHPFNNSEEYNTLMNDLKNQWKTEKYQQAKVLSAYKTGVYYPDAAYFILRTEDNKIQAIANLEIQDDCNLWIRGLNTAPWNQGKDKKYKNCARTIFARIISYCLETGNNTIKLADDNPQNYEFYKSLGMKEDGIRFINGHKNKVFKFEKNDMEEYLNKFQVNLSY